jgi:hypothetical protein
VFFAFAHLFLDSEENLIECKLFADKEKFIDQQIQLHLQESNISLHSYNEIYSFLILDEKLKNYTLISDEKL